MKSRILLVPIAALTLFIGAMHVDANAQIRTWINLSDRANAESPEIMLLQRHLQGQFERLTSGLSLNKRASVEARFQVDRDGHPVNINIVSATQADPELTSAAIGSIKAKSTYPEPLQCYRITFNFVPATPVATEPELAKPQVKSSKPCRTFTIDNNSLLGNRPVAQANPPQAINAASGAAASADTTTAQPATRTNSPMAQPSSAPRAAMAAKTAAPSPQAQPQTAGNPAKDINAYYSALIANIKRKWMPTAAAREQRVAIQFTIGSDGSLKSAEVAKSSGNDQADQAALKAIQACAPFRHLPTDCPLSEVQGQFTFGKGGMIN